MNWWYAKGDQKSGPVGDDVFREMVRDGRVQAGDLVWNESMATWTRAGDVPGLMGSPAEAASPFVHEPDGNTPNATLMGYALDSLKGKWGMAIAVLVLVNVVPQLIAQIPCAGALVILAIMGPLTLGQARFFLAYARNQPADLGVAFSGFSQFGRSFLAMLLVGIFVFLWMLLLIIPGIIKSYSYAMTWYIMADNPEMEPMEAIDRSMKMMDGRKWKFFCLGLRFIGWVLLALLTCGIGLLWVGPYAQVSVAHFYEDVKARAR
jgi:uncharacterized membrane protein